MAMDLMGCGYRRSGFLPKLLYRKKTNAITNHEWNQMQASAEDEAAAVAAATEAAEWKKRHEDHFKANEAQLSTSYFLHFQNISAAIPYPVLMLSNYVQFCRSDRSPVLWYDHLWCPLCIWTKRKNLYLYAIVCVCVCLSWIFIIVKMKSYKAYRWWRPVFVTPL